MEVSGTIVIGLIFTIRIDPSIGARPGIPGAGFPLCKQSVDSALDDPGYRCCPVRFVREPSETLSLRGGRFADFEESSLLFFRVVDLS